MQIINKIDKLISQLNQLKPELSDDLPSNEKKFTDLLKSNIEAKTQLLLQSLKLNPIPIQKLQTQHQVGYIPNMDMILIILANLTCVN